MQKPKKGIVALLLLVLALALYLSRDIDEERADATSELSSQSKPSAYMHNSRFTIYDDNGEATHIKSSETRYFREQDLVTIVSPSITYKNTNGDLTELNAKQGKYLALSQELVLLGNVVVTQQNVSNESWVLKGQEIHYNNASHIITSSKAVQLEMGENRITSTGISASIDDKKISLLSNVRARYVYNNI